MTKMLKHGTALALASLMTIGGLPATADAAGKKRVKVVFKTHVTRVVPRNRAVIVVRSGVSCGYFYDKWQWTGSAYWKGRYDACIYG